MSSLSVVLHAHLPYVAPQSGPLDARECWLYEALLESYLPLTLEVQALGDVPGRITLSISPTLLAMLDDPRARTRFPIFVAAHLDALSGQRSVAAEFLRDRAARVLAEWEELAGDLPTRWAELEAAGRLELAVCSGSHAVLPLLRTPQCRAIHIEAAACEFNARFGRRPRVMWLPECGITTEIDGLLHGAGVWASVVEARALGESAPAASRGKYAPIISGDVAFFARDPSSASSVWSSECGYPGDPLYREFHRALGNSELPLGAKVHRITGKRVSLDDKAEWDPERAFARTREHASDFILRVASDFQGLEEIETPHLCAAYDAELFGHWWFEGPRFLAELMREAARAEIDLVTLSDFLSQGPALQLATPAASTWGQHGDFSWWVDEATTWLIPLLHAAERKWLNALRQQGPRPQLVAATRQLMLAQASDWPFAIRGVTHAEYAKSRVLEHLANFHALIDGRGTPQANPQFLRHLAQAFSVPD